MRIHSRLEIAAAGNGARHCHKTCMYRGMMGRNFTVSHLPKSMTGLKGEDFMYGAKSCFDVMSNLPRRDSKKEMSTSLLLSKAVKLLEISKFDLSSALVSRYSRHPMPPGRSSLLSFSLASCLLLW